MEHEYRMQQLEVSMRQNNSSNLSVGSRSPKIPYFKEGDDVEVYMSTFEGLAIANNWDRSTWAPWLAALLTGKAREAYARLDSVSAGDYDQLKEAILARYDLTPETYRRKFRDSRRSPDESYLEWGISCRRYFERWVGPALNDPEKLSEVMIIEHMITNTHPDLQVWLREHRPDSVMELTELAETYRVARQSTSWKGDIDRKVDGKNQSNRKDEGETEGSCYRCGALGHFVSSCPQKKHQLMGKHRIKIDLTLIENPIDKL